MTYGSYLSMKHICHPYKIRNLVLYIKSASHIVLQRSTPQIEMQSGPNIEAFEYDH